MAMKRYLLQLLLISFLFAGCTPLATTTPQSPTASLTLLPSQVNIPTLAPTSPPKKPIEPPLKTPDKETSIFFLIDRSPSLNHCQSDQRDIRWKFPRFLTTILENYPFIDQENTLIGFSYFPSPMETQNKPEWWEDVSSSGEKRILLFSPQNALENNLREIDTQTGVGIVDAIDNVIRTVKDNHIEQASITLFTDGIMPVNGDDFKSIKSKMEEFQQDIKNSTIVVNIVLLSCPEIITDGVENPSDYNSSIDKWDSVENVGSDTFEVNLIKSSTTSYSVADIFQELLDIDIIIKGLLNYKRDSLRDNLTLLKPEKKWSLQGGIHALNIEGVAIEENTLVTLESPTKNISTEADSRLRFMFSPELPIMAGCPDTEWTLSTNKNTMAVFWVTYKEPKFEFENVRVFEDKTIINNEPFYLDYGLHETELGLADTEIERQFGECYQLKIITPLFSKQLPLNKAYGVQKIAIDTQIPLDSREVPTFDLLLQLTTKDQGKDVSTLDFTKKVRFGRLYV
jgi:hypothetical protein